MSPIVEPVPQQSAAATKIRRPAWVWVISIFYLFSLGFTLLSFALILSGAIPLTAAQQVYFAGLGALDYVSSIGLGLLTLTATGFLFALRKTAVHLFGTSLLLNVGFTLVHGARTNWAQAIGASGMIGALFGWGIMAAVFLYSRHLRQVGVLK